MSASSNPSPDIDRLFGSVGSRVWRMTLEALVDFEIQWRKSPSLDPMAFVAKYPGLPREVLLAEVQNLLDELSSELQPVELFLDARQPRFTILDEIRVGGMGVVYLGWDHDCNRHVAIKKIRPEFRSDPMVQARFHVEAELTADLEHPGIIPIYGKGVDSDGQAFYAMRLISKTGASTLSRAIQVFHTATAVALSDSGIDAFRQLVRHLIEVANTIAFCHKRGVVHRDLKPANILLGPYGETLVADWGLAKRITTIQSAMDTTRHDNDAAYILESSGNPVGTLGFAAPELSLKTDNADLHLSDIYSMGAILHSILFGLPPSESTQKYAGWATPLTSRVSIIPRIRYLVAIANMATSRDRFLRYRSAEAFRDDLLRWIEGESIDAMPESWIERIGRWISKHRTLASVLATAFGITVLAGSVFLWYQSNQRQLLDNQAVQLRSALADSARLLEKTQNANKLAELSQLEAQERGKQAQESREVAEKRELLAFEGLLRFQDILLDNQSAFESERLEGVKDQLLLQTKVTFDGILSNLSEETPPQLETLKYLTILTHRLAAMQTRAGKSDQAVATIDQACLWMQRSSNLKKLPEELRNKLHQRIGELRSLQGNISLIAGYGVRAKPIVREAIERLDPLIAKGLVSSDQVAESTAALAQAYIALSTLDLHFGDSLIAIANQRKAIELLSSPTPTTFNGAMAMAQARYGMAILYDRVNDAQRALEEYALASHALELAEEIQEGSVPLEFLAYRSQIVFHHCSLLHKEGRKAQAAELMNAQVVRDTKTLLESHNPLSSLEPYQRSVDFLQALYVEMGEPAVALELCQEWIRIANSLVGDHQQSVQVRYFSTMALHLAGHIEEQLGRTEQAVKKYLEALSHFEQLESEAIRMSSYVVQKVELETHLFLLNCKTESLKDTEVFFRRAVDAARILKGLPMGTEGDLGPVKYQLKRGMHAMRGINSDAANRWEEILKNEQLW